MASLTQKDPRGKQAAAGGGDEDAECRGRGRRSRRTHARLKPWKLRFRLEKKANTNP